jgi:NitT/TauT family transport system permease protein
VSALIAVVIWEIVGRFIVTNDILFVPFSTVIATAVNMLASGELLFHLWVSLQEFLIGFALAVVIGIALGVVLAVSPTVRDFVQPGIIALYSTPLVALAPLFILWLGIGLASKIAIVFVTAVFPVILNTTTGILSTEDSYLQVARSFGSNRQQVFRKILMPSALPFIVTGLRLAVGRGIVGVVVGEFFGSRAGLGFLILVSGQAFAMDRLLVAVLILAVSGVVVTDLIERLERRLAPWREFELQM